MKEKERSHCRIFQVRSCAEILRSESSIFFWISHQWPLYHPKVCMGISCDIDVSFMDVMEGAAEILENTLNERIEFEDIESQSDCFRFYVEEDTRIPGATFYAAIFAPIIVALIAVLYKITYH